MNDEIERADERDPFADLPLLGELRNRLEARFRAAEHLPARHFARAVEHVGAAPGGPTRHWLRHGRRSRLLLSLGALLLAGGTATAAVTLSSSQSAPLSGSVPGKPVASGHEFNFTEAGKQYRIVFVPQLSGGEAGWRSFLSFGASANPEGGEGGEGGYPTPSAPLAGGAGVGFTSNPLPSGDAVDYVLTAPRVAAVRVGDHTIQTRSGPALPAEDRAAVFFATAGSPPIAIPPAGARRPYYIRVPVLTPARTQRAAARRRRRARYDREHLPRASHRRGANHYFREHPVLTKRGATDANGQAFAIESQPTHIVLVRATPLIALDSDGREIAYTPPHPEKLERHILTWQVPRPGEHHRGAIATHPLPGACEIAAHGLPGLQPQWGHVLETIKPVADAEGELFLSCVDAEYYLHGWPLDTAILLDAHRSGQTLGPIPGASPVPGHPGVVNVVLGSLPGDLTARRVGNAWLVVEGGASLAQRLQVLGALRIAKLELPAR